MALVLWLAVAAASAQSVGKPAFDVASVRENKANGPSSMNFPLNPGPQYNHTGGLLTARNVPLLQLLVFAYAKSMYQIQEMRQQLPDWARISRFDVQARVEGSPTKDEMRAMMRTLLEERFALKTHVESRTVPVYRLVEAKPGKTGSMLKPYSVNDAPCAAEAPEWGKPRQKRLRRLWRAATRHGAVRWSCSTVSSRE